MTHRIEAYNLDWNPAIAEGYDQDQNTAFLIFNIDISKPNNWDNVIQYVTGRLVWITINFPKKTKISMSFDFRGQGIIISKTRLFEKEIMSKLNPLEIKQSITIDFLI